MGNLLHWGSIEDADELTPVVMADEVAAGVLDVAVFDAVEELLLEDVPVDVEEVSVWPVLLVAAIRLQMGGPD